MTISEADVKGVLNVETNTADVVDPLTLVEEGSQVPC